MTQHHNNPTVDFMVRLRKIDNAGLTSRDVTLMWAIRQTPGMMGRELAMKVGFESRSCIQDSIARQCRLGYVEDRRVVRSNQTPNDLHITSQGEKFLADIVPT